MATNYNSIYDGASVDTGVSYALDIGELDGVIVCDGQGNFHAKSETLTTAEINEIVQAVLDTGLVNVAVNGY